MTENDNDKDKPKDNVVIFPLHKRLRKDKTGPDPEAARRIKLEQTKEFVEGSIDDIGIELLKRLVQMGMKSNVHTFTTDLALVIDCLRGMIYRDFAVEHPAQKLADKMVQIRYKNQRPVATVNYGTVIDDKRKRTPIKGEFKEELDDTRDGFGEVRDFHPAFDLS